MKNFKYWIAALIVCSVLTTVPVAAAKEGSWYVGFGTGSSDIDESGLDDDSGTKFYGGYHFTDRYAIEGAWVDLGSFDFDFPFVGGDVDVDGIQVAGVAYFPIKDKLSIFGKAGLFLWDSKASIPGFGSVSDDGTDIMFGFGVQFTFGNWGVRGEWERFDADDSVDLLSVGVFYRR